MSFSCKTVFYPRNNTFLPNDPLEAGYWPLVFEFARR
jgi:hypothetical protein